MEPIILVWPAPAIPPASFRFASFLPMPSFFAPAIEENLHVVVRRKLPFQVGVEV